MSDRNTNDLIARLSAQECCQAHGGPGAHPGRCKECPRTVADHLETLRRERDEAVRDAERARQDRAHMGIEIRREWMAKCAELQRERDDLKALLKAVSPRAFAQMEKIRSEA